MAETLVRYSFVGSMLPAENIDYKQLFEQAQDKIASLNHELANLKKLLFGSKQERLIPEPGKGSMVQGSLDLHPNVMAACEITTTNKVTISRPIQK